MTPSPVPKLKKQIGELDLRTGEGVIEPGDFTVDEKSHQVFLTEDGHEHAEQLLRDAGLLVEGASLYDPANITLMHHVYAALRAKHLYNRDQHYVVQEGEVVIVDEFTGRLMTGRRWSDGLHQAVEAKEGVKIQSENQTLASITFQNYFRMYGKLGGMTGTADTEAYEFQEIYNLETVIVPPNKPTARKDELDLVYKTDKEKFDAVIQDIRDCHERGQPVLVGTTSIENSELISEKLKKVNLPHQVLNAKQHAKEAEIVAQAGRPGVITIATNMAGRGTDIVLGGNVERQVQVLEADTELPEAEKASRIKQLHDEWQGLHDKVKAAGGLRIIATERHESRRIDNQLRGRSGRQGDPGSSRFYLSLEDNLMRIFSPDWVSKWMKIFGMKEDDALEDRMVSRQIEKVQRKVEQHNFDIRKNLLEFDDVANDQRKVIYEQRNELLEQDDFADTALAIRKDVFADLVRAHVPEHSIDEQWDIAGLQKKLADDYGIEVDVRGWLDSQQEADANDIEQYVQQAVDRYFREREAMLGSDVMRALEKHVMLNTLDNCWKEHLASMDYLRQGIYLRGYAQKQPKQEFKRESFELFQTMLERIKNETTTLLARVRIRSDDEVQQLEEQQRRAQANAPLNFAHAEASGFASEGELLAATAAATGPVETTHVNDGPKVGRNDPCPCGSGKKYKQCHGRLA